MAHVLVIGASKGVGLEVVKAALAAGHHVRALSRSPLPDLAGETQPEQFRGGARNSGDITAALAEVNAVVQTLGVPFADLFRPVRLFSDATNVLVPAMEAAGIRRLIALTGFGTGDSGDAIGVLQRVPFQLVFGRAYADKDAQEMRIRRSRLDWTLVRPGVLTPGARTGRYQVLNEPAQWRNGLIARADVADFIVRQIDDSEHIGKTPVLVN